MLPYLISTKTSFEVSRVKDAAPAKWMFWGDVPLE